MALIKCKECGHKVSDKASMCSNCGCPIESFGAPQEEVIDEEPKKKKGWIWALIVALLCLIGGGGYYASTKLFNGGSDKDSIATIKDSIATIVELTPEFAKSLEVYDELGPFNEGYAAVRRGKKWGYINTKGEEVIPCSFDAADIFSEGLAAVSKSDKLAYINTKGEEVFSSPYSYYNTKNRNFSEGLAAVCDDGKWGWINQKGELVIPLSIEAEDVGLFSEGLVYCQNSSEDFSFVDKNGTVVFTGKTNFLSYLKVGHSASGYYSKDFPKFRDGFAYVNDDFNTVSKYTKYDKQGKKCGTISENELPEYRLIREDELGIFELYTVHMGLKGKDGNVLIKPYYSLIGTYDAYTIAQVSNGVVLVMLVEFSKYDNNVIYHYGYADLKGHDTFSKEIKEKVNKSREVFYQQLQEEESLQEGDEDGGSSSYSSNASSHPTTSVNAGSPKQEKELKIMARLHELGDEGRNLVLELSAMRQRGQMDPARYLYIKQALIQYKDEQIRLSQELGDEQMVREYMQQKDGVLQSFRMIENGY